MEGGHVLSFPGRKRNSLIFHCGDGFYYNVREVRTSRARLHCRHWYSGCPGTASVSLETGWLTPLQRHRHPPDHLLVDDSEMRQNMIREAETNLFGKKVQSILNGFKLR